MRGGRSGGYGVPPRPRPLGTADEGPRQLVLVAQGPGATMDA